MSENLKAMDAPQVAEKQRERSSIGFPYGDLDDALEVAQAVHKLGGRCSNDQLAPELGHKSIDSGTYGVKLATARWFGLISSGKEAITLLALGQRIVDSAQTDQAKVDAFLNVPLYRAVYERVKGYTLPPTTMGLENMLVELGVAAKQKDKARQALIRSAETAGFFYQGRDRLVLPAIANRPSGDTLPPKDEDQGGGGGTGGGGDDYPTLIRGMLEKLPKNGGSWSKTERDQWMNAFGLVLDIAYRLELPQIASPVYPNGVSSET